MLKKDYKLPQFNKSKILGISLAILFSLGLVFFLSFGGRVGSIFTSDFGNLRERIEEIWLAGKAYMLWGAKAAGGGLRHLRLIIFYLMLYPLREARKLLLVVKIFRTMENMGL